MYKLGGPTGIEHPAGVRAPAGLDNILKLIEGGRGRRR